ncbi:MAG: hypothetical protein WAN74_07750 [Thermoplasmata archaeon]
MSAPRLAEGRLSDSFRPALEGWTKIYHPGDGTNGIEIPTVPAAIGPEGEPLTFELNLIDWNGDTCPIPSDVLNLLVEAPTLLARASGFLAAARETRVLLNEARSESPDKDFAIAEAVTLLRELARRGAFDARTDNSFTRFIEKHSGGTK